MPDLLSDSRTLLWETFSSGENFGLRIACGQNYFLRSVLERVWSEVGETVRSRYRARAGSQTNVTDATISSHMKEGQEITFSTNMRLERH